MVLRQRRHYALVGQLGVLDRNDLHLINASLPICLAGPSLVHERTQARQKCEVTLDGVEGFFAI